MHRSVSWEEETFNGHPDNNLYETVIVKASLKLQARCNLANHTRTTNTFSKISEDIIV